VEAAFALVSPPEGVGWELMEDHVHPTVVGQVLLARAVLEAMGKLSCIGLPAVDTSRLRNDETYRTLLGDLPAGRVRVYRGLGELFSLPPMDRYNAHNAARFRRLAVEAWQALSKVEKRGFQQRREPTEETPLALNIADQLFAVGKFAAAERYYAATRREAPYTLMGDLWAAFRWALSIRPLGAEEFSAAQRGELQAALERCELVVMAAGANPRYSDFFKGFIHYLLGESDQALQYLERALEESEIRGRFAHRSFAVLAEELIRAGRVEHARHYVRRIGGDESHHFRLLVETLARREGP
jgi:tetratricopeptide (TPR) repeat protein